MLDNPTAGIVAARAMPRKPRQGRSPAFPFIPLNKAIERAETFRVAEGGRPKHFSPLVSACRAWGIGVKTGPGIQTIAALGHYGLFEFQGSGEKRSARLTDLALRILLDKQPLSAERDELIRQAALAPRIHAEIRKNWQERLPSDPTLETYLVRDRGFSESGARDLIAQFKETIAFAKLGQPGIIPPLAQGAEIKEEIAEDEIEIGDLIRAEIGGVLVPEKPVRVRAIQEHEGRTWVFVDGHEAGILMESAILEQKGNGEDDANSLTATPRLPLEEGWHEERLLDDDGKEIFIKYKGEPSRDRYEFIRDYLEFKLKRMKGKTEREGGAA
jgi:hypothetical protein